MDALKKLLEQAQALQEAAMQAELDKIRIQEQPRRLAPSADWSSEAEQTGNGQWSGQSAASNWVDPATVPVQVTVETAPSAVPSMAERLRNPETLRTFFLMSEAFGPPPGLRDEDLW